MQRIPSRLELARDILPKDGIGAELGTHQGNYADTLLEKAKPKLLHLVDNFTVQIQGIDGPTARRKVQTRFSDELASGRIVLHEMNTVEWLRAQPASSFDWLYIDSTHTDPHVYSELCQALRVVKAGGWICGHDYSAGATPGVVSAVDRFCVQHGQVLAYVTDEPELDLFNRAAWQPLRCAFNSYAIQVEK